MNEIEKKKKISTMIILIVVALLLIVGAYYIFGPNGSLGGTLFKAGVADISLDSSTLTVEVGDYVDIKATALNSSSLKYEVADTSIATVNTSGRVTGVKVGSTTVKVINSEGKYVECNITVKAASVKTQSITLDKTNLSLSVGQSYTLVTTLSPSNATEKDIRWDSSNESTATVNNGVVTAKSAGVTIITAYNLENKVATCIVTVTEKAS